MDRHCAYLALKQVCLLIRILEKWEEKVTCEKSLSAWILASSKKASADMQDEDSKTALMVASKEGHLEVVKQLLKKGARIDLKAFNGNTALMMAKEKGHHDIAAVLQSQCSGGDSSAR